MVRMGCLNSAVEVLTRLEMWEELALCFDGVGRKAKAVELVTEQLTKERTPSLLCLMGDITQVRVGQERTPSLLCLMGDFSGSGAYPFPPVSGGHYSGKGG
jgi:hypothetical protein